VPAERHKPPAPPPHPLKSGAAWIAGCCLLLAILIAVVTLVRFSPRYSEWRGLLLVPLVATCDCQRAFDSLDQLHDPWMKIENPTNRVIAWRLLFPLVWHYGHLPSELYLAMPWLGCLLALWLIAWCNFRRLQNWPETGVSVALLAALPWLFVSTGWLAYFDSWFVLGLIAIAFVRSRVALAVACLALPWIEERIVLGLPIALLVRALCFDRHDAGMRRELLGDVMIAILASMPYPVIRLIASFAGDPYSADYVDRHWEEVRGVPLRFFLMGLWSGFRAAWVVVGAAIWFTFRSAGRIWGTLLTLAVLLASAVSLVIAGDISRTLMILLPVVALGIWQWRQYAPRWAGVALGAILLAQYLLPAYHVTWSFVGKIETLPGALAEFENPPPKFQSQTYVEMSLANQQRGDRAMARWCCDTALRLDDQCAPALGQRAHLNLQEGQSSAALADAENALAIDPLQPDALYVRALIQQARGNHQQAMDDIRQALASAPHNWTRREHAEVVLKQLSSAGPAAR
jgi:hypothetical protein